MSRHIDHTRPFTRCLGNGLAAMQQLIEEVYRMKLHFDSTEHERVAKRLLGDEWWPRESVEWHRCVDDMMLLWEGDSAVRKVFERGDGLDFDNAAQYVVLLMWISSTDVWVAFSMMLGGFCVRIMLLQGRISCCCGQ